MQNLMRELGLALRGLRNSPAFAVTAIVTLALGIGATTAIFSVVNAVLLKPLPYRDPARLTIIWDDLRTRNVQDFPFAPGDFADLLKRGTNFSGIAAVTTGKGPVTDDVSRPEIARFAQVTWNVFQVLGLNAELGRTFVESDGMPQPPPPQAQSAAAPGAAPQQPQQQSPPLPTMVMLSDGFWKRRYGGDSALVGRTIKLNNNSATVVGIVEAKAELLFPPKSNLERTPDVWIATRQQFEGGNRINHFLRVIGRLKDGVTLQAAQSQLDKFAEDLRAQFPIKNTAGLYMRAEPMLADVVRTVSTPLKLLMGAVGFVLLIACANVANLLLVRASARERELAVRAALGGSRWDLVRQMLSESLVLAVIGGGLGLLLAQAGIDLFTSLAPKNLPRVTDVRIDGWVLGFSVIVSVAAATLFGLVPALRASRPNVQDVLRGGRAASQFGGAALRSGVVVAEVALSFVLLVGSGLMLRTFIAVAGLDIGYDPKGVLTFGIQNSRLQGQDARLAYMSQVRQKLAAIPGVTSVSAANRVPLDLTPFNGRWVPFAQKDDEKSFRQAEFFTVSQNWFETMKTRVIAGRTLTDADVWQFPNLGPNATPQQQQAAQTAFETAIIPIVVEEQLAKRLSQWGPAVGQRIQSRIFTQNPQTFEIVGVVQHQRVLTVTADEREAIYFPDLTVNGKWIVRSARGVQGLLPQVRAALAEIDPMVPIADAVPLDNYVDRALAGTRFAVVMLGIFALIAAVLACVGLYGVLASSVRLRTAEIGVRMAFGAPRDSILRLVIGHGLKLSAAGVTIGAIAALLMTGVMKTMLVGVKPTDPATFIGIAVLFAAVAAVASWVPARRAAALDPNVALQHE